MDADIEDLWRVYYCRAASGWAERITPEMYSTALAMIIDVHIPPELVKIGKPVFVKSGYHDVTDVAEHIDNLEKCVESPYVVHTMRNIKPMDLAWIDQIIKNRTANYENVHRRVEAGADEIKETTPCYTPREMISVLVDIIK